MSSGETGAFGVLTYADMVVVGGGLAVSPSADAALETSKTLAAARFAKSWLRSICWSAVVLLVEPGWEETPACVTVAAQRSEIRAVYIAP